MKAQCAQNWKEKTHKSWMDNVHKIVKGKRTQTYDGPMQHKTVMWQCKLYPEVTIHKKSWNDNIHKIVYKQCVNIVNGQFTYIPEGIMYIKLWMVNAQKRKKDAT